MVLKILMVLLALGALVGLGLVVGAWLRSRRAEEFAARANEVAVRVRFVPPNAAQQPVVTAEQRFDSLRKTAL